MVQNSQAAARPVRMGRLPSMADLARRLSAAIWRLNGTSVRRDLRPADYASVRRILDT